MMIKPIISTSQLGKHYLIRCQSEPGEVTFRDELCSLPRRLWRNQRQDAEFWALKGINFAVLPGERVGIIGKNGAGKSTLLKLLSRITEPSCGEIVLRGKVASLLEVGTGFHPELTGRENIYLNGAIMGMARNEIKRRFNEIVEFAGVRKFLNTPVKRYSSGMYVRLGFAIAAHLEPDILIVDEVLAVGDADFQQKCLGKLESINKKEGRTVLFVSHNLAMVQRLCNRVLVLDQGELIRDSNDVKTTVMQYLGIGNDTRGRWTNDKTVKRKTIEIKSFSVFQEDPGSGENGKVANDKPLRFRIEFFLDEVLVKFKIGFSVFNERGELVFMSDHTDRAHDKQLQLRPGRNLLQATLPPHILNDGKYRVSLSASIDSERWLIDESDGIHLWIEIYGSGLNVRYWQQRRPGMIVPLLAWEKL